MAQKTEYQRNIAIAGVKIGNKTKKGSPFTPNGKVIQYPYLMVYSMDLFDFP